MKTSFEAINAIVNEATDATADRVPVNAATIVNEAVHSVTGRVSAISDEAEGLAEHEQIITGLCLSLKFCIRRN